MESSPVERSSLEEKRRAQRYSLEARVSILKGNGEILSATGINISSSGMSLKVGPVLALSVGEQVTVEVEIPGHHDQPWSAWGLATVLRVEDLQVAIQLTAGSFHPLPGESGETGE